MEGSAGVRKGAWSREEDTLLQKCILKFGEGNWHRVPERAGLNRCRKSCRLRWLNYLSPNIKRGELGSDEIDLLIRLHNLLGNRWSLIAGRLPGRTANDLKNYWNTHFKKKKKQKEEEAVHQDICKREETYYKSRTIKPIKPKPRVLSANWSVLSTASNIIAAGAGDLNTTVQERERPVLVVLGPDQAASGVDSNSSRAVPPPPSYPQLDDLLLPEKFIDGTFVVEGDHHFDASDVLFDKDPYWLKSLHLV